MSNLHRPWLKATTLSLLAASILIVAQSVARADEVTFDATTAGFFSNTVGLTFDASTATVSGTTTNGILLLNNLGTFSLPAPITDDTKFTLQITFDQPRFLNGGQTVEVSADVVRVAGTDLVNIQFANSFDPILFDEPGFRSGEFQLFIFDLTNLAPDQMPVLSGAIGNAHQDIIRGQVPEPATLGLLATGLSGLIAAARRRRKRRLSTD